MLERLRDVTTRESWRVVASAVIDNLTRLPDNFVWESPPFCAMSLFSAIKPRFNHLDVNQY